MEDKNILTIPYAVYESMLDKEDRQQRRMVIIIILLIVLFVASNIAWLIAWNQFEYVDGEIYEIDASQDGEGINIVGAGGDIDYGAESENQSC